MMESRHVVFGWEGNCQMTAVMDPEWAAVERAAPRPLSSAAEELARLREMYVFAEGQPVAEFLAGCPHVVAKLLEARPRIDRAWGARVTVVLDVVVDYEDLLNNFLFGFIETEQSFGDAMATMRRFDREWWTENGRDIFPRVIFDVRPA
jgi:hypothetical protein